jgi:hypothetical protein
MTNAMVLKTAWIGQSAAEPRWKVARKVQRLGGESQQYSAHEPPTPIGEDIVWTITKVIEAILKWIAITKSIIYDISPLDTYFLSNAGRGSINSTLHEWQTDSLTAAARNAKVEGDDHSAPARTQPTRLKNYAQISRKDIVVTGTARKVNTAGMREVLAYHTARAAKEIKRDIEVAALGNFPASAGSSVLARTSGGVPNWIYEGQHYKLAGQTLHTTTALVAGFATATGGSWTSSVTDYAEADLKDMLKLAWSTGGEVDVVMCDSIAFNRASTFTGVAQRFRDVASRSPAQVIGYSDVYVSPYGTVKLVLSRYIPANSWYGLTMDMWEFGYLRPFQTVEIAKSGDSDKRIILAEWTLIAKNPLANCKAHGVE